MIFEKNLFEVFLEFPLSIFALKLVVVSYFVKSCGVRKAYTQIQIQFSFQNRNSFKFSAVTNVKSRFKLGIIIINICAAIKRELFGIFAKKTKN